MNTRNRSSRVTIDDSAVDVPAGASVVAALVIAASMCTRRAVTGGPRFAFCGIGQCQECRVTIDGRAHRLACRTVCTPGMIIETGGDW
jgi:predicted molibdopterin-dependent oxidoreductase YjgC